MYNNFNIYNDIDIHRVAKAFGTHLKLLRIYSIPLSLLPHLHFKTKDEIIHNGLIQFMTINSTTSKNCVGRKY